MHKVLARTLSEVCPLVKSSLTPDSFLAPCSRFSHKFPKLFPPPHSTSVSCANCLQLAACVACCVCSVLWVAPEKVLKLCHKIADQSRGCFYDPVSLTFWLCLALCMLYTSFFAGIITHFVDNEVYVLLCGACLMCRVFYATPTRNAPFQHTWTWG